MACPNRKCTPDAMVALKEEKNISLMEEFGVLTKTEMLSRYEVEMEHYSKIINIEARTMLKIASKQLIPAATSYMAKLPAPPQPRSLLWKASPPSPKQSC